MPEVTRPTGATWWWHLSDDEQEQYLQLREQLAEQGKIIRELQDHLKTWQTVANNRCRAEPEHYHSMNGLLSRPRPAP